jgi:methylated-DNA-protein-cysteine methyltransferase-like protein
MAPGFTSPPDPQSFKIHVWEIVRQIPLGRVATYGQISHLVAARIGAAPEEYRAFGARWVGWAMASCPSNVPWQRVINSQGKISLSGTAKEAQRTLLEAEGIIFDERDRVDLKQFQWSGPI